MSTAISTSCASKVLCRRLGRRCTQIVDAAQCRTVTGPPSFHEASPQSPKGPRQAVAPSPGAAVAAEDCARQSAESRSSHGCDGASGLPAALSADANCAPASRRFTRDGRKRPATPTCHLPVPRRWLSMPSRQRTQIRRRGRFHRQFLRRVGDTCHLFPGHRFAPAHTASDALDFLHEAAAGASRRARSRLGRRRGCPAESERLKASTESIPSSMVPLAMKLTICTRPRTDPIPVNSPMRCSRSAGFHGRSMFTSVEACCRFSPAAPASVERKTRQSGSARKRSTSAGRFFGRHAAVKLDVADAANLQPAVGVSCVRVH